MHPVIRDGKEFWEQPEPRLVFNDLTFSNLSASYRGLIDKVNAAISEEASETYKLRVIKNPLTFIFPRNEYGRVEIERGVFIKIPSAN